MSTSTMMLSSMANVSAIPDPFISPMSSMTSSASMSSYYKSLPALDKHCDDQLDREIQHMCDSMDVLYQQEDKEIDFLDSFIDYDDIGSVQGGVTNDPRVKMRNNISGPRSGRPPITPSETVSTKKDKIREGLGWLSYKGKLSLRTFGSRNNLKPSREETVRTSRTTSKKKLDFSMARSYSDLRRCRT